MQRSMPCGYGRFGRRISHTSGSTIVDEPNVNSRASIALPANCGSSGRATA